MLMIATLLGVALAGSAFVLPAVLDSDEDTLDEDEHAETSASSGTGAPLLEEDAEAEDTDPFVAESNLADSPDPFEAGTSGDELAEEEPSGTIEEAAEDLLRDRLKAHLDGLFLPAAPEDGAALTDHLSRSELLTVNGDAQSVKSAEGADTDDTIIGGEGMVWVDGKDGNDTLLAGTSHSEIDGGSGDDLIVGHDGYDTLVGGSGDDVILGGDGNDEISGGTGTNVLSGGDGDDRIYGGGTDDEIHGGAGKDYLVGGDGATLIGGLGQDTLVANGRDNGGVTTLVGTVFESEDGQIVDKDTDWDMMSSNGGDTMMVAGSGDVANLGSGEDAVVVGDWVDKEPVLIRNFDSVEDTIVVVYDDAQPEPEISFAPHPTSADLRSVLMDGSVIANVKWADSLTANDVHLVPLSETNLAA